MGIKICRESKEFSVCGTFPPFGGHVDTDPAVNCVSTWMWRLWTCCLHTQQDAADSWTFLLSGEDSADGGWFIPGAHYFHRTGPKLSKEEKPCQTENEGGKNFSPWIIHRTQLGGLRRPFTAWLPASECVALLFFYSPALQNSLTAQRRSIQSPYLFYNHSEMSAQTPLCHLWQNSHCGCFCRGVYKPRMVEMAFAPRLAGTQRAAIWQSHRELFTRPTFMCLHAVNKTCFAVVDEPRALTGRAKCERRSWRDGALSWESEKETLIFTFSLRITDLTLIVFSLLWRFCIFKPFKLLKSLI